MMRLSQTPSALLSLLLVALSNLETAQAWPVGALDFNALLGRQACASYCGADSQYCCTSGQSCTTNAANIASCVEATGNAVAGGTVAYTTTWTETDLHTYTSTYYPPTTAATSVAATSTDTPICDTSEGQTSCGSICCASNQRCEYAGQCIAFTSTFLGSTAAASSFSAPLRGTSSGAVSTATSKVSVTTTQPFQSPATASGSTLPVTANSTSHGLSAGAIAGIVIGVIAGVALLLLLCFCCIVKAGFDGLLALFGLKNRRRRETERIETVERYSRHGSGTASRRDTHKGWFGMGGGRPASSRARVTEKESSGFGGLGAIGAGLLGLAVILGLKRNHDKDRKSSRPAASEISSSYYSYTDTSASSASSDRRTRDSRRTRDTRYTHSRR